jgi:FkbM family methyltransferase
MGIIKTILPEHIYVKYIKLRSRFFPQKEEIEQEETAGLRIQFYNQFLNVGDLVFDVGANFGNRIVPFLNIGCDVIAVEPQQKCYEFLEKKFGNKIRIVKKGLSDKEEIKEFYISNASTISTFSKEWLDKVKDGRFKYYEWNKVEKIEMTTLDLLIHQYGSPKFIKIDVEGYELEVIKGLSNKIEYISIEYNVPENINNTILCINHLYEISKNIKFNYSVGETMNFALMKWLDKEEMLSLINSKEFISTSFGDIYVNMK